MKLPMSWMTSYSGIEVDPHQFIADMTMSGSKVESMEYLGEEIQNVVVGKVLSVDRHPDADKLVICQIDVGDRQLQIVTGADNVVPGALVPVALDGSLLPGGKKIKTGKLRGVESQGMLCSIGELNLTVNDVPYANPNGILLIEEECELGEDIRKVYRLDDYVVDFEITSNRPDCLSAIGLGREAAATYGKTADFGKLPVYADSDEIKKYLSVSVDEPKLCPRYTAKMIKDVKIAPSPLWLRARLYASGVRPINNIVDITNYVMLEYGQPMHAFDYACLTSGHINVRRANKGEVISTLDDADRKLDETMLVIADETRPVAVAGVMGGANSEITDATKTIVFESANFFGASIRITAQKLGMRTESSGRFEKGLDSRNTMPALLRACQLVEQLGAGTVVGGLIDIDNAGYEPKKIKLDVAYINRLLGTDLDEAEMIRILKLFEFKVNDGIITVPSWRTDVECGADIAEEIARLHGYNTIPSTLPKGKTPQGAYTLAQLKQSAAIDACRAVGYSEAQTYSFVDPKYLDMISIPADSELRKVVRITNPLGAETSVMRTVLLPSMLDALARNFNYRNPSAALCELGNIYVPVLTQSGEVDPTKLPDERPVLIMGSYNCGDFFQIKGDLIAVMKAVGAKPLSFVANTTHPSYHPGRTADVYCDDVKVGIIGQVHPLVTDTFGLGADAYVAEIDFALILENLAPESQYVPLPKFPAVSRDIAVICDRAIPVAELEKTIRQYAGNALEALKLFDVYTGEQISADKKSVAYSLTLRAADRTLTDDETNTIMTKVLKNLERLHNAVLR